MKIPYKIEFDLENIGKNSGGEDWFLIEHAQVTGGSRLVLKGEKGYIPNLDQTLYAYLKKYKLQEEAQVFFKIEPNKDIFLMIPQTSYRAIKEKCFSALSPFSQSWVHWLFEIMPQIIYLQNRCDRDEIKILVESDAPAQIYETLTTFFSHKNIVKIPLRERVVCKSLLIRNDQQRGWSILWARDKKDKLVEAFHHDIQALKRTRETIYKKFNISGEQPTQHVFIRRKAKFRFIVNEGAIAEYLFSRGFSVIEPSRMSFKEQVECFSRTKIIVAQAGASLANLIFMKPGSTIVTLAAKSEFLNYDYFASIAKEFGVNFVYVLGQVDDETKYSHEEHLSINHPMNASFIVNKSELEKTLMKVTEAQY